MCRDSQRDERLSGSVRAVVEQDGRAQSHVFGRARVLDHAMVAGRVVVPLEIVMFARENVRHHVKVFADDGRLLCGADADAIR